jgi:hypothetical protein
MLMPARNPRLATVLALLAAGCADGDLPKYQKLGGLRILALQADAPEIAEASLPATVNVVPFVTDVDGAGRQITLDLEACLDPGVGFGATPSCAHDPTRTTATQSFTPAAPRFTGAAAAFAVTVPVTVPLGWSETARFNGVPYLVIVRARAGSDAVDSIKRIIVSTRSGRNSSNPAAPAVQKDGSTLSALPAAESVLTPLLGSGLGEAYPVRYDDGTELTRTETTTLSWFVNDGELKHSRTDGTSANTWKPPVSGTSFLVLVLRDDRGGVSFGTVGP